MNLTAKVHEGLIENQKVYVNLTLVLSQMKGK